MEGQGTGLEWLLRGRRSTRSFDAAHRVPGAAVGKIVEAGLAVPSPSGSLPVSIYELKSREVRERLEREVTLAKDALLRNASGRTRNIINYYWRYTNYLFGAPLILAVALRRHDGLLGTRGEDTARITAGLSLFSMSLMIEDLGFSSTILTAPLAFCPDLGLKIGIDEKETPCAFLAVGKRDERVKHVVKPGRDPAEHFIKL